MAAKRIAASCRPDADERLESLGIHSIAGRAVSGTSIQETTAISRAAQHDSDAALLGAEPYRTREISLAHHGVLFLDELPEFRRSVLKCSASPGGF